MKHLFALLPIVVLCLAGCRTAPKEPEYETITPEDKFLAARADAVIKEVEGTPGQEQANFLRTPPRDRWIKELRGETPAKKGSLGWPRKDIACNIRVASMGPDWPRPPLARVPFAAQAPKIDGRLDDPAWAKALTYHKTYLFNTKVEGNSPKTTWKLMWDDKYLYVAFDCVDVDIVSAKRRRDEAVYEDDCVEMMILPDFRFRAYWELIIGPSDSIYDSIQCKDPIRWGSSRREQETIAGLKYGIQLRGTLNKSDDKDEGYSVEIAVPFDQLPGYSRCGPKPGDKLWFILVRLDKTGKKMLPYAYQPLLSWGHNIWNHAQMELVK